MEPTSRFRTRIILSFTPICSKNKSHRPSSLAAKVHQGSRRDSGTGSHDSEDRKGNPKPQAVQISGGYRLFPH